MELNIWELLVEIYLQTKNIDIYFCLFWGTGETMILFFTFSLIKDNQSLTKTIVNFKE